MRILLLADGASVHTQKWAFSLSKLGYEIGIWGLNEYDTEKYEELGIKTLNSGNQYRKLSSKEDGQILKSLYLSKIFALKKAIKKFAPDILHAHYASSYGLMGTLTGFRPYVISVWGSDVYDFPKKSFIHRLTLRFSLKKADLILSTSNVMAAETRKYTDKEVEVTPFGVDTLSFVPDKKKTIFSNTDLVIGTIKTLEDKYGISYLIESFHLCVAKFPNHSLKLLIVGDGSKRGQLEKKVEDYGLKEKVFFSGRVPHNETVRYYNELDIYVALSTLDSESFGVAIVEASSCGLPVVVSAVGGLPEVVLADQTGFVVPNRDSGAAAKAMGNLILNKPLRELMGRKGREHVLKTYNWGDNVHQMANVYQRIIKQLYI